MRRCFCSKCRNFGKIFAVAYFMSKTGRPSSLISHSRLAKRHRHHFKCPCTFNLIFYTKFNTVSLIHFWNNLRFRSFHAYNIIKICSAWAERYANVISNLSNSDSTIIQIYFLHCFNVIINYWRVWATRMSIVIDKLSAFFKPVIPLLNLCSARCRLAKHFNSQHFKCSCTFNFIFYTNLNTFSLVHFSNGKKIEEHTKTRLNFLSVKNKLTIQNDWYCQHMYITDVKIWKSNIRNSRY